ncbi:FecR family protein [Luteimonas marina]|uniref:FecR family protein n=1 Tax=Luteimonas marina TaxID=488485 RepID=A0A5C5U3M5_9GAMM|nr:FecR family protein [Luteimonas marina]TWT20308.1 FecR family protein [Luteimonas marina]
MGKEPDIDVSQRATEEAAEWVALLDSEDCTDAEREEFERWHAADPRNALAYHRAKAIWRDSNAVIRSSMALSEAARHALQYPPKPSGLRRWWLPAASLAAIGAAAVFLFVPFAPQEPPAGTQYATAAGDQRGIALADGSNLTLDTQTVVVERYSPGERRVDLLRGQAQFEVQGNPERPFVVHALGGTVTAIGTRFQVRVEGAGATVTLQEGQVHVAASSANGPARVASLQPGQTLRFDADGTLGSVQNADLRAVQGWMEGKLYVDNWRLQDFVAELNRYSDTKLRIDDPALAEERISGVFQTRNRDSLGRLLAQGWGIQSRQVAVNEILLTRQ